MSKRRKYSDEFKREAVQLTVHPGVTKSQIARELGINPNMLGRWCRELQLGGGTTLNIKVNAFRKLRILPGVQNQLINWYQTLGLRYKDYCSLFLCK